MPTLNWIGKEKVVSHHQDVPYRVLEHKYGFTADKGEQSEPTNSGNKIIHGDNLEALKSLLPEYEGKIKCIYIDPPYNTGNESWVYNDNVNHPKIKKWLGEVVGKDGEDLTRHDKWLCMMYPRLKLLHKLLADDGAIFISIDDNEQANLKLICDEIFGVRNFIANVAVVNNFKGRSDDKYIATAHESLMIFQKGKFETKGVSLPEEYAKDYKLEDEKGKYRHLGLRKRGSNAREIDRPNLFYPIYYCKKENTISLEIDEGKIEILPKLSNGDNGTWRWGKETLKKRLDELEVKIVKTRNEYDVFQKDYLNKEGIEKRVKPKSFWHGSEFSAEAGTLEIKKIFNKKVFDTPKSSDFVFYIIQQTTDKDSIVLDSFAGSGTTAHAVLNLNKQDGGNRKFILVEMEDYANDITAERVKRVTKGYGTGAKAVAGTGGAFDYYELGLPLFDKNQNLNEQVGLAKIREYIWFSETRTSFIEPNKEPYFLGKKDESAYYFIYEKDRLTTLDYDALELIKTKGEQYVIYADNCLLPKEFMAKKNIIFKKIPRDITRF
ncbi:site-specific DNA-methyltransferase [Anaerophaga thermohalophila]|jgi:adenine-specific DNA-methyltransferase|uniref:site-specific DNA-methyltransferase n=1 Tax=Anaerophaga thermohalophila TaxID=177400 RepID=UPI0003106979|nr:site-specific DNA-methyltransferase [Anaerophaga thermohalophila]